MPAAFNPAALRNLPDLGFKALTKGLDQLTTIRPGVDDKACLSRHDVGGIRLDFEDPAGGDESTIVAFRQVACLFLDENSRFGRRNKGIAAQIHRRRAGMVERSRKPDLDACDPRNRRDQTKVETACLKHDALFDVQLEKRDNVTANGISKA
jgi:hypothetical protein